METNIEPNQPSDPTQWANYQQAFASVVGVCTASQALYLKKARDSHAGRPLGLTWEEYCEGTLNISRPRADHFIRRYKRFGAPAFELAHLAHVSDRAFDRLRLGCLISGNRLQLNGHSIEINPENAHALRAAIKPLLDRDKEERKRREIKLRESQRPAHQTAPLPDPAIPVPVVASGPPDKQELQALLDRFFVVARDEDRQAFHAICAPGAVGMGPAVEDRKLLCDLIVLPWKHTPLETSFTLSPDGKTAWFDMLCNIDFPANYYRISGCMIFHESQWKFAQFHLSKLAEL